MLYLNLKGEIEMHKNFGAKNWREFIPKPVCEAYPHFNELYEKSWELAFDHIKFIDGMPQNPYMDEAFCETQVWIWDTCFMTLFCKYAREVFPGVETLNNFYELLYGGKKLPVIIPSETEPEWTGGVPGKPYRIHLQIADNPPLFAWAEYENVLMQGDKEYIKTLLYERQVLQKHYEWFESLTEKTNIEGVHACTCLIKEEKGYRWEGGRSGMDNTPRGRTTEHAEMQRPNNPDMLWLDAICQQALSAQMIAKLFALLGDVVNEQFWKKRYEDKKETVNRYYWDELDQFYYDIDCNTGDFYKIMTIASYWALTAEIASKEQAEQLVKQLHNTKTLHAKAPFLSLSRSDNDYQPDGRYWRGGVWLPTAYAAVRGLDNYGMYEDARVLATELIQHMYDTYVEQEPHTIWECYAPESCEPAYNESGHPEYVRKDFCGWSALGPISVYIEQVLGFHKIDAFRNEVHWEKPADVKGQIGIRNLRFGKVVTDIVADDRVCTVITNEPYTLLIRGVAYQMKAGENRFVMEG